MAEATTVRIGVAGLGTVGGEAVRLLRDAAPEFGRRFGRRVEIAAVCDRRAAREASRLRLPASVVRYTDPLRFAEHPDLDIVVETLGGLADARRLVLRSLARGRHVVTANKRLLAHHWEEPFEASRRSGRRLQFEASVAGGIPILGALHRSLAGNRVRRVLGILNGTTNFILTRMAGAGETLPAALREAQRRGLAEADPTLDLDGTDAAHKVAVLASLVTGRWVRPEDVARAGIGSVAPEDLAFAASSLGRTVRLLGAIEIDWERRPVRVSCHVYPTLVPLEHPLAAVQGEYNAVLVQASAAGDLMFYGKGAGGGPAASAVAGDVLLLAAELGAGSASDGVLWREPAEIALVPADDTSAAFYLRLDALDRPGALSRIAGTLGRHGISISRIHQEASRGTRTVPIFLTTHAARQKDFVDAVAALRKVPEVGPRRAWFRML